ncbi:hypothetical protein 7AX2_39 [uncultured phage]|uniref:Uncharacterized protein n=1 Tax=uncultured Caudovirales phage TaxID=2100421 RepID=A0A2H4IY80_9CAUD|nr:hypothetical protein 7AX2_39 [uncultured phage]ASN67385.1 hypothetical protein 2AX2_14 [uncultured Caudovirales phage]ASN68137.1 hypothetical protein 7S5_18 [uncultured Caudovirales phage]ASN71692.1 hypothetical protein 3S7_14 [uncultured Caudovirales phage]
MTITFSPIVYQQLRLDGFAASAALFYARKAKTSELMNLR